MGGKVRVLAKISGLKPNGEFGFHIHEVGDCSSGDGMSTKGHYNPLNKSHAHYSTPERHAGDMPVCKLTKLGIEHVHPEQSSYEFGDEEDKTV